MNNSEDTTGIPTAVLEAERLADEALEADAQVFSPEDVGSDQIMVVAGQEPEQPGLFGHPPVAQQQAQHQHEIQHDVSQTQETQETTADGEKIELTQEQLQERINSGKNEIRGLFESRLKGLSQLSEENKNLRKRLSELEDELAASRFSQTPDVDKLREEYPEFADYGDDEVVAITNAIRRSVGRELKNAIPNAARSLREEFSAQSRETAMGGFVSQLNQKYPGIVELDSMNDPVWLEFLSKPVPGTGSRITYGVPAKDALDNMDFTAMSEIIDEFVRQTGHRFGSSQTDRNVRSQVRPKQSSVGGQKTQGKPYFTTTQVNKINKDIATGAIFHELSEEAVAKLLADLEEAEFDGRIVSG